METQDQTPQETKRGRGRPPKGTPRPSLIPQEEMELLPPLLNQKFCSKEDMAESVYIGRESAQKVQLGLAKDENGEWGNPFPIGVFYGNRADVVERHEKWLKMQLLHPTKGPELMSKIRRDLGGRKLRCWCVGTKEDGQVVGPDGCHGQILRILANASDPWSVVPKMRGG